MNIEIANRLVRLRKQHDLSQEALAEKLGLSRQAVSKWERAEAAPDIENLIALSQLYGVTVDEILKTDGESEKKEEAQDPEPHEHVHISPGQIHVEDGKDKVHIGWDGIHVEEKGGDTVDIGQNGTVYINGERREHEKFYNKHEALYDFPIGLTVLIVYFVLGVCYDAWHPAWLIFFLVPILHSLISAIERRRPERFAYPLLVALAFLCIGIFWSQWAIAWVLFLTIPLYYSMIKFFRNIRKK